MTTAIEQEADALCEAGLKAGASILSAIDNAYEGRSVLPARKFRRVFDCMIDSLTDEMSGIDAPLFTASAYEAIPQVLLSQVERAEINSNAHLARAAYMAERASEAEAELADYRYDQMRDERMMERA
jgi:hypothetical protein